MDNTKIEWCDSTWNVITGCSVSTPGCTNCYAMKLAGTRLKHEPTRIGLTDISKAGPVWNGKVRFNEHMLTQPIRWRRSRKIFVCAHGDLFHESVPDEWIDKVFAVMALAPHHIFQVLTKRAERMRDYLSTASRATGIGLAESEIAKDIPRLPVSLFRGSDNRRLPLNNVWMGVSVEDQQRADERIPLLLETPATVRWISAEPMLGPIDLDRVFLGCEGSRWIDWTVAGGESALGSVGYKTPARPMHPQWVLELRDHCLRAGVPFLFKQWGNWAPNLQEPAFGALCSGKNIFLRPDGTYGNQGDWWSNKATAMEHLGKKKAGRILDGQEWNGYPEHRAER